jgi:hypothetical protein
MEPALQKLRTLAPINSLMVFKYIPFEEIPEDTYNLQHHTHLSFKTGGTLSPSPIVLCFSSEDDMNIVYVTMLPLEYSIHLSSDVDKILKEDIVKVTKAGGRITFMVNPTRVNRTKPQDLDNTS